MRQAPVTALRYAALVTFSEQRLAFVCEAPALAERAVRTAFAEALRWRCGGGAPPETGAVVSVALAALKDDPGWPRLDAASRMRLLRGTARATRRAVESPLCRRLLALAPERFARVPSALAPDPIVRDAAGGLHLISIVRLRDPLARAERARELAAAMQGLGRATLAPPTVHLLSLADGRRSVHRAGMLAQRSRKIAS